MPEQPSAGGREDEAVVVDQPAHRVVVQLVAANAREVRAAVAREEDAHPGVRVGVRVRFASTDPEAMTRVDGQRTDRERRRVVGQRLPLSGAGLLPDAAVSRACVEGRPVDSERGHATAHVLRPAARVRPHRIAVSRVVTVVRDGRLFSPASRRNRQVLVDRVRRAERARIDHVGRRGARLGVLVGRLEHLELALARILEVPLGGATLRVGGRGRTDRDSEPDYRNRGGHGDKQAPTWRSVHRCSPECSRPSPRWPGWASRTLPLFAGPEILYRTSRTALQLPANP